MPVKRAARNTVTASAKLSPAVDKASEVLTHVDTLSQNLNTVVVENRAEIHDALLQLRASLADAQRLLVNVNAGVEDNRDNLDDTLENVRVISQNLKGFSDTIKRRPNSLVFAKEKTDRVPPRGK